MEMKAEGISSLDFKSRKAAKTLRPESSSKLVSISKLLSSRVTSISVRCPPVVPPLDNEDHLAVFAYVSPEEPDEKWLTSHELVAVYQTRPDSKLTGIGLYAPSADTPAHIEIYRDQPDIDFVIMGPELLIIANDIDSLESKAKKMSEEKKTGTLSAAKDLLAEDKLAEAILILAACLEDTNSKLEALHQDTLKHRMEQLRDTSGARGDVMVLTEQVKALTGIVARLNP